MSHTYASVNGKTVKLVEEDIEDLEAEEAALALETDVKQNSLNDVLAERTQAEQLYSEAEAAAEAASAVLEEIARRTEVCEAELAKSVLAKDSLAAAIELAGGSDESEDEDGTSEDTSDDEEYISEEVPVDVTVVPAG